MKGRQHVYLEDVVLRADSKDGKLEVDSEIEKELAKFDDTAYKTQPEKLAESIVLERMVKFDKTIKLVMDHVRRMMKISNRDLNRHINETILGPKTEPSALLKYYNELELNTNFAMPNQRKLDFDLQVFRKTINRIVKAHGKEVDWVRNVATHDTKAHLERCFGETSQQLQAECSILID